MPLANLAIDGYFIGKGGAKDLAYTEIIPTITGD